MIDINEFLTLDRNGESIFPGILDAGKRNFTFPEFCATLAIINGQAKVIRLSSDSALKRIFILSSNSLNN